MKKQVAYAATALLVVAVAAWAYVGGWHETAHSTLGTIKACACKTPAVDNEGNVIQDKYEVKCAVQGPNGTSASGYIAGLSGNSGRVGRHGFKQLEEKRTKDETPEWYYGCVFYSKQPLGKSAKVRIRLWKPPIQPDGKNVHTALPGVSVENLPDCEGENGSPCPPPAN